jgi:hypothetical protein
MKLTLNVVVSAGSKFCHQGPGVEHHLAHRLAHSGEPDSSHRLHSHYQASGKFNPVFRILQVLDPELDPRKHTTELWIRILLFPSLAFEKKYVFVFSKLFAYNLPLVVHMHKSSKITSY